MTLEVYSVEKYYMRSAYKLFLSKIMIKAMAKLQELRAAQRLQLLLYAKSSINQKLSKICQGLVDQRNSRRQDRRGL